MVLPFTAGTPLSASKLNGALGVYQVRAAMNSGMTIGTSFTTLTGWTEERDDFAGFDYTTGVFTVPSGFDGSYIAWGTVPWVASTQRRLLAFFQGSTERGRNDQPPPASSARLSQSVIAKPFDMAVGDTLTLQAQSPSSSTSLDSSFGQAQLFIWKVG